jgi:hypothetical protein
MPRPGLVSLLQGTAQKHGRKLWWLHSTYALALGIGVLIFAQKGFDRARWLSVSVGVAWLLVVVFFRLFGSGRAQTPVHEADTRAKVRFYAMSYVLKNLYQGMLFFLLPFYYKSTSFDSPNAFFIFLLAMCALISTLDLVFDKVVLKWSVLASLLHGITLFGCLNLVVPALFPEVRTLYALLCAAFLTAVAFWTIHVRVASLKRKRVLALIAVSLAASVYLAWVGRKVIPPVPMYVAHAAVGPGTLPDGRLTMEVRSLHSTMVEELSCVTDVVAPGGKVDKLHHVWKLNGHEVHRSIEDTSRVDAPERMVRFRSALYGQHLPQQTVGHWSVDVETEDAQLVGRAYFDVTD